MNITLPLHRYPLSGDSQRHLEGVVEELFQRGHRCRAFCSQLEGEAIPGLNLRLLRPKGLSYRARERSYMQQLSKMMQRERGELVLGFDPMPGLDVYFAGESPYTERVQVGHRGPRRQLKHERRLSNLELGVFSPTSSTRILTLNEGLKQSYKARYQTADERFQVLPPGISPDFRLPENGRRRRSAMREEWGLAEGELCLLFVATEFYAMGLDRVITALANVTKKQPGVQFRLVVVGDEKIKPYQRMARKLGVEDALIFLEMPGDLRDTMVAADLFVHAPRVSGGDYVLLQTIATSLPAVTSEICGHSLCVSAARSGFVLQEPFSQNILDRAVMRNIDGVFRADCRECADDYLSRTDLWSLYKHAVDQLEAV